MKKLSITKIVLISFSLVGASSVAFAGKLSLHEDNEVLQALQAKVSLNQAIDLAKAQVPANMQSHLTSAKFKYKKGGMYAVKFGNGLTSQEVKLNANTGMVFKTEHEKMDSKDVAQYNALLQSKVTLSQAMSQTGQIGQVIKGEFEIEKNVATYELEVIKDSQLYKVLLDANTGAVLSQKLDAEDDKHDHNKKQGKADETEQQESHEKVQNLQYLTQVVNSLQSA